ncbi:MAG: hypothetical protein JW909_09705 [Planctomycetes bacterium]|nr:hypothetical protein [Planctomycetota bacterium]
MKQSPVVIYILVALALLTIILTFGVWSVSSRLGALEYYAGSNRSAMDKHQAEISSSTGALSRRTKTLESDLELWSKLLDGVQKSVSLLRTDVEAMKSTQQSVTATDLEGLKRDIAALRNDITEVKEIAEAAAEQPAASAAADTAQSAPAAKEVKDLATRLDSLDSRVSELAKKSSSAPAANVQVNEQAVREAIDKAVQDEVAKALEEMRTSFRTRRPREARP